MSVSNLRALQLGKAVIQYYYDVTKIMINIFNRTTIISNFINEIAVCFLNIEKQHYKLPEYLFTLIIFHNRMVEITYRIRRQELVEPMVKILKLAVQSHCT